MEPSAPYLQVDLEYNEFFAIERLGDLYIHVSRYSEQADATWEPVLRHIFDTGMDWRQDLYSELTRQFFDALPAGLGIVRALRFSTDVQTPSYHAVPWTSQDWLSFGRRLDDVQEMYAKHGVAMALLGALAMSTETKGAAEWRLDDWETSWEPSASFSCRICPPCMYSASNSMTLWCKPSCCRLS
ncbi:hypothetical protein BV25DRAFT_292910 [Artomyces pyxidatus]|uniref:Uncharacterized protein n=1 Tax=Artomyces pyxidatus TaxID=48021 RepID=A0ACB8T675_9AGAM|nr:hypothetical protein BV25DRAFT_292910 [Artomyces pyxidatus]